MENGNQEPQVTRLASTVQIARSTQGVFYSANKHMRDTLRMLPSAKQESAIDGLRRSVGIGPVSDGDRRKPTSVGVLSGGLPNHSSK